MVDPALGVVRIEPAEPPPGLQAFTMQIVKDDNGRDVLQVVIEFSALASQQSFQQNYGASFRRSLETAGKGKYLVALRARSTERDEEIATDARIDPTELET